MVVLFCHMKEDNNMTAKEIFILIKSNGNVSISDKKDTFNSWRGDCGVKRVHSESLDYGDSGLIITVIQEDRRGDM